MIEQKNNQLGNEVQLGIKVIQTQPQMSAIINEWEVLENEISHPNLTSSYVWLSNWWHIFKDVNNNTFGYDKELVIICLYENNSLISIAPFVKEYRKKFGIKLSFI
jgi:hypothetical protein